VEKEDPAEKVYRLVEDGVRRGVCFDEEFQIGAVDSFCQMQKEEQSGS